MSERPESIAIIGAGVIGLTTALEAQRRGVENVTIYAERPPMETTSAKAGAVFEPYKPGKMSGEEVVELVETGIERYKEITDHYTEAETGIRNHDLYSASTGLLKAESFPFLDALPGWELLESPEVPGGYRSAVLMKSVPFIDPTKALPWLANEFQRNGGILKAPYPKIRDLSQFVSEVPEDIVFNCSGLGARDLLQDNEIKPMRGQIVVVNYRPKWDWSILADDGYYVFPRASETILGGTTEEDVWEEVTRKEDTDRIFEKAKSILPGLDETNILREYAGLRPYRVSGVRVDIQEINGKLHISNVGFGGSGWTFCWGAAKKAMNLAFENN